MQDRMWHVCGHLSVCTVSQWGLGILHGKCGVCGPHPAVPQAKPQIKPSSAPCPRQSLCSPALGAFSRAAFAPTSFSFSLTERHSTLQPRTSAWPCASRQSTDLPAWPEHPTMPREKVDLPAAMLGWEIPSVGVHPFPLHSTVPCSVV